MDYNDLKKKTFLSHTSILYFKFITQQIHVFIL